MRKQPIGIMFIALGATTLSLAQGTAPAPTGIQKNGAVSLLRAESKLAVGGALVENTTDNVTGAFVMSDYTNYTPPPANPATTIGPCIVVTISLPLTPSPPTGIVTTILDAGPVLNVS